MTTVDTLKLKISEVEKYYQIVKKYQDISIKDMETDDTVKGAVERYLYLLCQSSIDLGEALISYYKYRIPTTYADIFDILYENNFISKQLALSLARMSGFRNILTHSYGKVNFDIVYQVLTKDINIILEFVHVLKEKMKVV